MMIVASLSAAIFSTVLKLGSLHQKVDDRLAPSRPKPTMIQELSSVDPFSDQADLNSASARANLVAVKVNFFEGGSSTEELSFDWIAPFEPPAARE